jgi:glycosyltransferase involved in cell wall biosynthesis
LIDSKSQAKWICCQIGAREHYAVARALHRHRALDLLLTDAWVRPGSLLGRLKPSLGARFHAELATENVHAPNIGAIAFELRAKLAGLRNWPLMVARNDWFQKAVVARLSQEPANAPRTVMAYSYAALEIFKLARARGWRTVLGQIDPGPPEERIVARLYEEDPAQRGTWQPPPRHYWSNWREECALADRIVVNSRWSRMALMDEGVPATKIRVVPLAYDDQRGNEKFQREHPMRFTDARPLRVLFLGQINLRKGVGPMLDAIRLLRGEPVEFSLVGPLQISVPTDMQENSQVRWIGRVPRKDTAQFYRDADVLLFPTFSDGFGLTQLEAQAWKLPIIATKFCGDVVEDGRNGWLLPDVTAAAIAETIRRLLAEPSGLQRFSAGSVLAEQFGLARVGERWLQVFE